jgi:hypothetical protein
MADQFNPRNFCGGPSSLASAHRKLNEVIEQIRPAIMGRVNYFRVGNSRRAFDWITL